MKTVYVIVNEDVIAAFSDDQDVQVVELNRDFLAEEIERDSDDLGNDFSWEECLEEAESRINKYLQGRKQIAIVDVADIGLC